MTRTGGLVPALLEIVRERFRQKGYYNLSQLATAGAGAAAAVVADAGAALLSPALSGETLTERIMARAENYRTRRTDDLVSALASNFEAELSGEEK